MERRSKDGVIYERTGEGWRVVGYEEAPAAGGQVIRDAADQYRAPKAALEVQSAQAGIANDAERLRLAREDQQLQREAARRAADKEARDKQTLDARGGAETTEAERTAAFLATRVAGGLRDLGTIGKLGAPSLKDALVGGTLLGNYTTDENRQRTINTQRDVLDAALTLGTGAAYTKEQIEAYRASYFPQPGDQPKTIEDKARRLQVLMSAARVKAGAAAPQIDVALEAAGLTPPAAGAGAGGGNPLSTDQQRLYDAYLASNPQATAAQLRAFASSAGLGTLDNAEDIVAARDAGAGVRLANTATETNPGTYEDSLLSQGLSGVNEGIASTLGAPVDLINGALGLGAKGINAIANTNLSVSDNPFLGGEWWKQQLDGIGSIAPENEAGAAPFVRRVGRSVGAAAIPVGATAGTLRQVGSGVAAALGGGIGGATAEAVAPGNQIASLLGEVAGGGLTAGGFALGARRSAQRVAEAAVPSVDDLKAEAGGLYQQAEANGVTASPQQTQQLADDFRTYAAGEGLISPTGRVSEAYPRASEALRLVDDYAGGSMSPTQMQTVRKVLSDARQSTEAGEGRIARALLDQFDDFTAPLAPELADARNVASRYLSAETLDRAGELAGSRAGQFSGSGYENALRTEYRGLDRKIIKGQEPGFNSETVGAIQDVARGTSGSNVARALGKMAPTGVVSAGLGSGVPFMIGSALGGPAVGAAAAIAAPAIGTAGRAAATRMGLRNAEIANILARSGGVMPQAAPMSPELQRLIAASLSSQGVAALPEDQVQ